MKKVNNANKATTRQENPAMRLYKLLDDLGGRYEARSLNIDKGPVKGRAVYQDGYGFEVFWDTRGYRFNSRPGFKPLSVDGAIAYIINLKPNKK